MTRRDGIIAVLAAATAASVKGQTSGMGPLTIQFQKGSQASPYYRNSDCKPSENGYLIVCNGENIPEPEYALAVKYGDREVKLKASEIMDALEAK